MSDLCRCDPVMCLRWPLNACAYILQNAVQAGTGHLKSFGLSRDPVLLSTGPYQTSCSLNTPFGCMDVRRRAGARALSAGTVLLQGLAPFPVQTQWRFDFLSAILGGVCAAIAWVVFVLWTD